MKNRVKSMNTLRQIIRMKNEGMSNHGLARRLSISRNTIRKYLGLFSVSGKSWAELLLLDDAALNELVNPVRTPEKDRFEVLKKRFEYMEKELRRVGVTKWLLWEEYRREAPSGYSYSQFCYHFQQWLGGSDPTMHFEHKAGDKLFVDFAGKKLSYVDPDTAEILEAEVFVAILGASQLTYVEAVRSQKKEDFLSAMSGALEFIGGVSLAVVPDNLKSAVTTPDKYEPELNPTLAEWGRYYGTTILPARAARPRDKALVEGAVKLVYQQIYAPMRNQTFRGLGELNRAIGSLLKIYNSRPFHRRDYSRRDLFAEIEQTALAPLPLHPYEFKKHIQAKVAKNSHVWLGEDKHYYSVPYRYIGQKTDVFYNASTVEIFLDYHRIAFHKRNRQPYKYSTCADHMPSTHQFRSEWSPEKFSRWAEAIGPNTAALITQVLEGKTHPEQAYKSCLGILNMARKQDIGKQRLELACKKAIAFGHHNYKFIERILKNKLEAPEQDTDTQYELPLHENIRGEEYYDQNPEKSES